jgi:hypothetical protein
MGLAQGKALCYTVDNWPGILGEFMLNFCQLKKKL